jgi:hypothetical protein
MSEGAASNAFKPEFIASLQAMVRGVRAGQPAPAFRPLRPLRLDVFRYFTGLESAAVEELGRWQDVDAHSLQDTFESYHQDQVSLCLCLTQQDRASGAWQGVIAGGWRPVVVCDPREAMEAFIARGWIPSPAQGERLFYDTCSRCYGSGEMILRERATGRAIKRERCDRCVRASTRSRRGCGVVLCDMPGSVNSLAHWTMLGRDTIQTAEYLASEIATLMLGAANVARVRWIPVTPRTWRPTKRFAVSTAWGSAARSLMRVGDVRGRSYFMSSSQRAAERSEGNPFVAMEVLHDLGLALHAVTSEEIVIAYPTTS